MNSSQYQKIRKEYGRIYAITPNDLGIDWLTSLYKFLTSRLKRQPFLYLLPISCLSALLLYLFFGKIVVLVVNILQHGF